MAVLHALLTKLSSRLSAIIVLYRDVFSERIQKNSRIEVYDLDGDVGKGAKNKK